MKKFNEHIGGLSDKEEKSLKEILDELKDDAAVLEDRFGSRLDIDVTDMIPDGIRENKYWVEIVLKTTKEYSDVDEMVEVLNFIKRCEKRKKFKYNTMKILDKLGPSRRYLIFYMDILENYEDK